MAMKMVITTIKTYNSTECSNKKFEKVILISLEELTIDFIPESNKRLRYNANNRSFHSEVFC